MSPLVCCAAAVVALLQQAAPAPPASRPGAEATVMSTLEELRAAGREAALAAVHRLRRLALRGRGAAESPEA